MAAAGVRRTELLARMLLQVRSYIDMCTAQEGYLEETMAIQALEEMRGVLAEVNGMTRVRELEVARDAVGDICFLLIACIEDARICRAEFMTYEAIRDAALQSDGVWEVDARCIDAESMQKLVNYYSKARELTMVAARHFGVNVAALEDEGTSFLL